MIVLVLTVNGAPKPDPKPSPKAAPKPIPKAAPKPIPKAAPKAGPNPMPKPDPKAAAKAQMAIIFNNGSKTFLHTFCFVRFSGVGFI